MKRKLAWSAVALSAIIGALLLLWPRDPITRATYDKIELGTTLAETEAIVGSPGIGIAEMMDNLLREGRRLDREPDDVLHQGNDWSKSLLAGLDRIKCWQGTHAGIAIQLDDDGRVIGKRFEERLRSVGLAERFRSILGW